MRKLLPFLSVGFGLLSKTACAAYTLLSLSVTPSVITINTPTQITYTIKNTSTIPFTKASLTVPATLPIVSSGITTNTPVTIASGTTCAINGYFTGTLNTSSVCKVILNVTPTQYGRLELNGLIGHSAEKDPVILPVLQQTSILVRPSSVFFFGDSYSDIGLIDPANAPKWVDVNKWPVYLGTDLQLPAILPATQGGTNYACGGAHTGYEFGQKFTENTYGVLDQIDLLFKKDYATKPVDPNALTFIWAAGNDLKGTSPTPIATVVANLQTALTKLSGLGLKRVVMINQGPWYSDFNIALAKMVTSYNTANLNVAGFIPVTIFDYSAAYTNLYKAPANYGFANVVDFCNDNPTACTDADRLNTNVLPFLNAAPGTKVTAPVIAWYYADGHPNAAGYQYIETMIRNYLFPPVWNN